MSDPILLARRGALAEITLNRPHVHNAFDDGLVAALQVALDEVAHDEHVRFVMLTGAGKSFSAGADLNWMRGMANASEADNRADSLRLATLMRTLNFFPKPTVARVNGAAYGGGVGLVACCDIAIGVQGAKFSLSEVKLGLVPAVISPYVTAAIGARHARRLFVTGEVFEAEHAARIGLLHEAVAADELDAAIDRVVHFLSKGGPLAQREAKHLALRVSGMTPEEAAATDECNAELIARLRVSEEGQHGLGAFLDKRAPRWAAQDKENP
ncbi:MAG TPA: enoyl-CoA hydratase-related protein [Rhodanobacteraceae bacterium]|nr:enoyl-CoA hydratase-related protein [Rhodanobacteraceae bacterium]